MLPGHVNLSMNNMRRDRIKNSLQKDLHSMGEAGNPPTTLLVGDDLPKKIGEEKESLTLKDPLISESCIEITIELNFYFHTSLWYLKRFYEGLKGLHKTF